MWWHTSTENQKVNDWLTRLFPIAPYKWFKLSLKLISVYPLLFRINLYSILKRKLSGLKRRLKNIYQFTSHLHVWTKLKREVLKQLQLLKQSRILRFFLWQDHIFLTRWWSNKSLTDENPFSLYHGSRACNLQNICLYAL